MSIAYLTTRRMLRATGLALAVAFFAAGCSNVPPFTPQAPSQLQSAAAPGSTLIERQQRTAMAHSQLEEMRYEERLAQQDYSNAQAAYQSAQETLKERKRKAEAAKAAYDAARARTALAQRRYEQAMRAVDALFQPAAAQPSGK